MPKVPSSKMATRADRLQRNAKDHTIYGKPAVDPKKKKPEFDLKGNFISWDDINTPAPNAYELEDEDNLYIGRVSVNTSKFIGVIKLREKLNYGDLSMNKAQQCEGAFEVYCFNTDTKSRRPFGWKKCLAGSLPRSTGGNPVPVPFGQYKTSTLNLGRMKITPDGPYEYGTLFWDDDDKKNKCFLNGEVQQVTGEFEVLCEN